MTLHSYHRDIHEHGLVSGCPRCEQLAVHPLENLDRAMLDRLGRGIIYSPLDRVAAERLAERLGVSREESA